MGGDDHRTRLHLEERRRRRSLVTYTRLDSLASNSPGRFISGIYVDPGNPNHAWISYSGYSGYSSLTPSTPGHIFLVTYNQGVGTATWTSLDGSGEEAIERCRPIAGSRFPSVFFHRC